jgi:hypothetical protein
MMKENQIIVLTVERDGRIFQTGRQRGRNIGAIGIQRFPRLAKDARPFGKLRAGNGAPLAT